jgi:hypothetical protein
LLSFDCLLKELTNIKYGSIYTQKYGLESSKAIEIWEKNGWSIDLGTTSTQLFAGFARDVYKNKHLTVDVGAGLTSAKQIYTGIHIKF